jgi:hypothetical protein
MQSILCIKVELSNKYYCTEYETKLAPITNIKDRNAEIAIKISNGYNFFTDYTRLQNTCTPNILLNTIS